MTDEFCHKKSALSIKDYSQKIDELLLSLPNAKIFLATDNIDIQKMMDSLYPNRIFYNDKWFSKPGDKIHFNDDCPDKLQSLKDAVTEMGILSQCNALIYQYNSSFGECAHIFSKAKEPLIFPLKPNYQLGNRIKNFFKRIFFGSASK